MKFLSLQKNDAIAANSTGFDDGFDTYKTGGGATSDGFDSYKPGGGSASFDTFNNSLAPPKASTDDFDSYKTSASDGFDIYKGSSAPAFGGNDVNKAVSDGFDTYSGTASGGGASDGFDSYKGTSASSTNFDTVATSSPFTSDQQPNKVSFCKCA